MLIWFAVAIVGHDLVLMPLYTAIDRVTIVALHRRAVRAGWPGPAPYLRIPAMIAALLFLVHLPVLLGQGAQSELAASGIAEHGYLLRWALLTRRAVRDVAALAYAVALARGRGGQPDASAALSSRMPAAKSSCARKPSTSAARCAEANTWRTSPSR